MDIEPEAQTPEDKDRAEQAAAAAASAASGGTKLLGSTHFGFCRVDLNANI